MRRPNDFIYLNDDEHKTVDAEAQRVINNIATMPYMNKDNLEMSKRGFMCELVGDGLLGLPLKLTDGLDKGYDIYYNGKYIDVKSMQIKERWTAFTKDNHDLKLYRFKNDKPHDFIYWFISSTENPKIYVIEGACTQGQLLAAIAENKSSVFFPTLHYAGEEYCGRLLKSDMVTVPNNWLPYQGIDGAMSLINS